MKLSRLLLIPLSASFLASGCSFNSGSQSINLDSIDTSLSFSIPPDLDEVAFEGLNFLLKKEYTSCKVSIKTTKNSLEHNSQYNVTKNGASWNVSYSKERYATIDTSNANPESPIITETGESTYEENPYPLEKYVCSKDKFDSYFFGKDLFEGRLINGKTFLNSSYNANNFALNISYSVVITNLEMKYSLDDNTIVLINYLPVY